jgi:hypothetical protein
MAKIQRAVQYRYLDRSRAGLGEKKLDQALREALHEKRDGAVIGSVARARIADLEQSGQLTVWNGLQGFDDKATLAGELLLYKQGFDVTAIEEDLEHDYARFKLVNYQTDGKNKPVEGALYFAVIGDSLGIIQSNAVTGRWLERYLTWLLKDIAGLIEAESVINLSARIYLANEDPRRRGPAKALSMHAQSSTRNERALREKARGRGGTVLEVLELLGVGRDTIDSIEQDIPQGGRLEGDFLVYIKEGNKRREISMGTVDHMARNAQSGELDIIRPGSKVRENMLSMAEPVRLTQTQLGFEPNEAMAEIVNVLYKWAEQGIINLGPE